MDASARPLTSLERTKRAGQDGPLTGLIVQTLLLAALTGSVGLSADGWIVGLICAVIIDTALARGLSRYGSDRLEAADWVTLARASLAVGIAALVADSFAHRVPVTLVVSITALALALDFVDGWVARRTRTMASLGARFDGEVDAFLILILSVYVARSVGAWWVLSIGVARYAFLAAGWPLRWMRAPLPPRFWRKTVAAAEGIVLTVAASALLPRAATEVVLVLALALLAESFGRDVWWLWQRRHPTLTGAVTDAGSTVAGAVGARTEPAVGAGLGPEFGPEPEPGRRRLRVRKGVKVALTVLAAVLVWVALVAPYEPHALTLRGFLTIPLEALVLIAIAAVLPRTPRRDPGGELRTGPRGGGRPEGDQLRDVHAV